MKRNLLIIILAMMLLISACSKSENINDIAMWDNSDLFKTASDTTDSINPVTKPATDLTETVPETLKKRILADEYGITSGNYPKIDGSTSTIPLHGGLRAMLFDIPQSEAELLVSHTKTHTAFQKLIDGECDIIFSVPVSDEQKQYAIDKGVDIEMIPIAAEGFVFVINKDNPVETLTQSQIRDIYSGKITNWKEVGGNDAAIIAYQRNKDSGSQNHMTVFMGDTVLSEPKLELTVMGMEGLMDSIAVYDNSIDAIGYSVYSYAAQIYSEAMNIKFISVDDIPVSPETLENSSYPLISATYIIHRKDLQENTPAGRFVDFVLSDNGRLSIQNSGYIPYTN